MPQLHTYVPKGRRRASQRGRRPAECPCPDTSRTSSAATSILGWPDGFFERVAGRWLGPPLRRSPQGRLEDRESW